MPTLWQIIEKKKNCAVNVTSLEDRLTVNILIGRKRKSFSHTDTDILLGQLKGLLHT